MVKQRGCVISKKVAQLHFLLSKKRHPMSIKTTLEHLNAEKPLSATQTTVLICPPMTESQFNRQAKQIDGHSSIRQWILRGLFRRRTHDFLRIYLPYYPNWTSYRMKLLKPLTNDLRLIADTGVHMIPDATGWDFRQSVRDKNVHAIFLVAHHIVSKDAIEFADGAYSFSEIEIFLKAYKRETPTALLFFVCHSAVLDKKFYGQIEHINSIGWSKWAIGWGDSMAFIGAWLKELNGNTTLSSAYHRALRHFLNSTKNDYS